MEYPNTSGGATRVPRKPPTSEPLLKTSSKAITEMPRVSTASSTPLVRSAGSASTTPTGTATSTAMRTTRRKGRWWTAARRPLTHAPTPAMVSCASDSCPTYPVTTTTDRATIAIDRLTTNAVAQSSGTVSSRPRR